MNEAEMKRCEISNGRAFLFRFFYLFSALVATVLGSTVFFVLVYLSKNVLYQEPRILYHSVKLPFQDCLTLFVWDQLRFTDNHQDNDF